jgi:hypothetical protein
MHEMKAKSAKTPRNGEDEGMIAATPKQYVVTTRGQIHPRLDKCLRKTTSILAHKSQKGAISDWTN